jgi:hypothetical protein
LAGECTNHYVTGHSQMLLQHNHAHFLLVSSYYVSCLPLLRLSPTVSFLQDFVVWPDYRNTWLCHLISLVIFFTTRHVFLSSKPQMVGLKKKYFNVRHKNGGDKNKMSLCSNQIFDSTATTSNNSPRLIHPNSSLCQK